MENYKQANLKVSLPYIKGISERLRRSSRIYNINVYLTNNYKLIDSLFWKHYKYISEDLSDVVCFIKRISCNKDCIVETRRKLKSWTSEHKIDCELGKKILVCHNPVGHLTIILTLHFNI